MQKKTKGSKMGKTIKATVNHAEIFKNVATQERHEQERIFAYEQTRRHGEQINKHTEEIKEIKELLDVR